MLRQPSHPPDDVLSIIMMIVIINDDNDNCGGDEAENDINDEKGSEAQQ